MTVAQWVTWVQQRFEDAGLSFSHGTDNAADEAAWLVLHVLEAPLDGSFEDWGRDLTSSQAQRVRHLAEKRCELKKPLAYLLGEAWFAGLSFEVDENVLVPRSPIAELILDGFQPWLEFSGQMRLLDMCTGSGCIAIAMAKHFQDVHVDAVDISTHALQVAKRNVIRHAVEDSVNLLESDLFSKVPTCEYDLIVSNPPYVSAASMSGLADEFRAEPGLGLQSGDDGLDAVLGILAAAPEFMSQQGILVCEVGESDSLLSETLPTVPFLWLEFSKGGSGVFLLTREELLNARPEIRALIRN